MAYLNDPREDRFGSQGQLWESGNRVEKRYLWNGAFRDLCDLPPEEYMKTIFVTNGGGGGGEGGGGLKVNEIVVIRKCENGKVLFQAIAEEKVASKVIVDFVVNTSNGKKNLQVIIDSRETHSNIVELTYAEGELKPRVESIELSPSKDKEMDYEAKDPIILPTIYSISLKKGELETLDDMSLLKKARAIEVELKNDIESIGFSSNLNEVQIPGLSDMPADEFDKAIADNSTDVIFLTDKKVQSIYCTDDKNFEDTFAWTIARTIMETGSGIEYNVWLRRDETGPQTMLQGGMNKNWNIIVTFK